jgi:phospholipid-transporting ATPase
MKYKCLTIDGISYGEVKNMTKEEVTSRPEVTNVDFED